MKQLFLILVFVCWGCFAQTIEPYFRNTSYGKKSNVYYKDIDNDFSPYVGIWLYTNGATSFKIVLKKREMIEERLGTKTFYNDYLVGEYQYIDNNIEKVNTLSLIATDFDNVFDYNLTSTGIVGIENYPKCNTCMQNERRVSMFFNEPTRRDIVGLTGGLMLRRVTENGIEKIIAILYQIAPSFGFTTSDIPTEIKGYSLPWGEYILTKVN